MALLEMLFLKLPFAVKPGLTDSRFSRHAKQCRLNFWVLRKVRQGGWSGGNSQVI